VSAGAAAPAHGRVVVGAGICGLAAAWRAARAGEDVVLVEASPRVGGVIRTERVGPYRTERAAAAFPANAASLLALLSTLPARPEVAPPRPEADRPLLLTGRGLVAAPKGPGAFLASPLLSPAGKARLLAEPLRGPRRAAGPESAHAFVRRRFGAEAAERLLRPMTLGIYGTRPEDLGLADAFPALAEAERDAGGVLRAFARRARAARASGAPRASRSLRVFAEGMEALPRAVAAALGARVVTAAPVAALRPGPEGVVVEHADGTRRGARAVLLAAPAHEQARLVAPFAPVAADLLAAVRYVPMAVVAVGLAPGECPPVPQAFGFLRGAGARVRILGATFASRLDPSVAPEGHALLRVFLGGGADPGAVDLSDDAVRDVVTRDLSRALGGPVRPSVVAVHRWPRAIPVLAPGHRARMAAARRLLAPHGIGLTGSHVTGVSVDSCCSAAGD
jgi:oxygen-dependent protoporphyrinogen oxidase